MGAGDEGAGVDVMSKARMYVDPGHLCQKLGLPDDHSIIGAEWDFMTESVVLFVEIPEREAIGVKLRVIAGGKA